MARVNDPRFHHRLKASRADYFEGKLGVTETCGVNRGYGSEDMMATEI
jgi:hypothetical protein